MGHLNHLTTTMRYPKLRIALIAAAAVIGASALAIAARAGKLMPATPKDADEQVRRLDQTIDRELRDGCVEADEKGRGKFCGRSAENVAAAHDEAARTQDALRARPAELRETAVKNIRRFRGRDELRLDYRATSSNPYRDDESLIETYVDDEGNEYWIDPAGDSLVQMGPGAGADQTPHKIGSEARLPVAELRRRALELAEAAWPGFNSKLSSLHPLEDNKDRQIYFFRWDDFSAPLKDSELPPFLQVALRADGRLVSFTDTLRR